MAKHIVFKIITTSLILNTMHKQHLCKVFFRDTYEIIIFEYVLTLTSSVNRVLLDYY